MEEKTARRIEELTERLVRRSRHCPGLFLLESADEFLAVAEHQRQGRPEALALTLESFDRHPEVCHQAVNQWLLARGFGGVHLTGSSGDERRYLRESVRRALDSTCQSQPLSAS